MLWRTSPSKSMRTRFLLLVGMTTSWRIGRTQQRIYRTVDVSTRASDFRWERPKGLSMRSASAGPGFRAQASCANDVQSCVDFGPPNVDKVLGGQA